MHKIEYAASTPPAAPNKWPIWDLVEETFIFLFYFSNIRSIAKISTLSPDGVEVPCALI